MAAVTECHNCFCAVWHNWLSAPLPSVPIVERKSISLPLCLQTYRSPLLSAGATGGSAVIFSFGDLPPLTSSKSACTSSCSWYALISTQWPCSHSHVSLILRYPLVSSAHLWLHGRKLEYPSSMHRKYCQGQTPWASCCTVMELTTSAPCCPC